MLIIYINTYIYIILNNTENQKEDDIQNDFLKHIYDVIDSVGESFRTILIPTLLEEGMLIPIKKR